MITKFTSLLYSNPPASIKGNDAFLAQFPNEYVLITDSQDIEFWLDFVSMQKACASNITAAIVKIRDGELIDIWFSESGAPYMLSARYHNLDFYRVRRN